MANCSSSSILFIKNIWLSQVQFAKESLAFLSFIISHEFIFSLPLSVSSVRTTFWTITSNLYYSFGGRKSLQIVLILATYLIFFFLFICHKNYFYTFKYIKLGHPSTFGQGDPVVISRFIRDLVKTELERCLEEAQHDLHTLTGPKLALVIDGKCLMYALDPNLRVKLLKLSLSCTAVVCCRVSPLQKAQVNFSF